MGDFIVYVLKSSGCLVLFYLFYRLILSRETFHHSNRIALLSILFISFTIPFVRIPIEDSIQIQSVILSAEQLITQPSEEITIWHEAGTGKNVSAINRIHAIFAIYWAGVIFFICYNIFSLGYMLYKLWPYPRKKLETGIVLITHDMDIVPFSWMKYIVISEKDMVENGQEILLHEQAHVQKHHSMDVFLVNIGVILQWFNPVVWLFRQELQNIHEYEADDEVLNKGINAKEYQLLLIKKAVGKRLYSMANSFNHSKLKKRITMMSKRKSNQWARLKYLYVLPVIALSITAFARPEITSKLDEISTVKFSDLIPVAETNLTTNQKKGSVIRVNGLIKDSEGNPIAGMAIFMNEKDSGVKSGKDGKFILDAPSDAILSFTMDYNKEKIVVKVTEIMENIDVTVTFGIDEVTSQKRVSGINVSTKERGRNTQVSSSFSSTAQSTATANRKKEMESKKLKGSFSGEMRGTLKSENGKEFNGNINLKYENTFDDKGTLKVTLKNENAKPMAGVAVTINDLDVKGITDSDGGCSFEVPAQDSYTLKFDGNEIKIGKKRTSNQSVIFIK